MTEPRSLDDLFMMYSEVCEHAFLGYEERWGEPMPDGGYIAAPLAIRRRIEAAIREEAVAPLLYMIRGWAAEMDSDFAHSGSDDILSYAARWRDRLLAAVPEPGGEETAE